MIDFDGFFRLERRPTLRAFFHNFDWDNTAVVEPGKKRPVTFGQFELCDNQHLRRQNDPVAVSFIVTRRNLCMCAMMSTMPDRQRVFCSSVAFEFRDDSLIVSHARFRLPWRL